MDKAMMRQMMAEMVADMDMEMSEAEMDAMMAKIDPEMPRPEMRKKMRAMLTERKQGMASKMTWSTEFMNDLPDGSFLFVEPGDKDESGRTVPRSKRHFPYKDSDGKIDLPHLRNAIARIPQSNAPGLSDEKKTALQNRARRILAGQDKSVKIMAENADTVTLGGWLVVYGEADLEGETFSKDTDFWLASLGNRKPVLYDHGFDIAVKTAILGEGTVELDEPGLWFEMQLDRSRQYAAEVLRLVEAGTLGLSSGAVGHLVRREGKSIKVWPIAEASLTPTPAEPRTLGVTALRSLVEHVDALKGMLQDAPAEDAPIVAKPPPPTASVGHITILKTTGGKPMADEVLEQLAARVNELDAGLKALSGGLGGKLDALLKLMEDEPAIRKAGYITMDGGTADPNVKTLGDFLLAVRRGDEGRIIKHYKTVKALAEGDGTAGGYVVPIEQRGPLLQVAIQASPILGLVQEVPVGSESGTYPALDQFTAPTAGSGNTAFAAGVVATATVEAGTLTETEPKFAQIEYHIHKVGGYTKVSNELVADSSVAIEVLLRSLFGVAVASKRERHILRGSGVGEPLGILNAPCAIGVTTATDNTFAYADALNMIARFKRVTGSVRWVMHQGVLPDLGATGWTTGDTVRRIADLGFGEPILSEHMPQDDNDDVLLADFGTYLLFMRQPLAIAYSEHAFFTTDEGAWRFTERIGGQPWQKNVITLADPQGSYTVSPFVYHDD